MIGLRGVEGARLRATQATRAGPVTSRRRPATSAPRRSCSRPAPGASRCRSTVAPSPSRPTSWSSPNRSPSCCARSAGRRTAASPTAATCSSTCGAPKTTASRSAVAPSVSCSAIASAVGPAGRPGRGRERAAGAGPRPRRRLAEVAAAGLTWLFPQLTDVRFTHAWSGPMDVTPPGLPFFHTWPGGDGARRSRLLGTRTRARRASVAGRSPRWCSAPTTSGRACRSLARRWCACRRNLCAGRWSASRRGRSNAATGPRAARRSPRPRRGGGVGGDGTLRGTRRQALTPPRASRGASGRCTDRR